MLDKYVLSSAVLLNLKQDTHLNTKWEFTWVSSIFYFGYMLGTPVHGYFLQHAVLSRYLSCIMMVWGVVVASHAGCHNYHGLLGVRFCLGLLESAVSPSLILMTGRFYTRAEQMNRTFIWFSFNGWAFILAGLFTYGILRQAEPAHISRWQELYIILGAVTFVWGVACFFLLPSSPDTTTRLTPEERTIAVLRIAENQSGVHDSRFKWGQVREAVCDIRLYLFFFGYMCLCISNGGITSYSSQIITGFRFDNQRAALLGMAQGLGEVVALYMGMALFMVTKRRDVPSLCGMAVAFTGSLMMVTLGPDKNPTRMGGLCMVMFFAIPMPIFYNWQSSSVSGTTKRIVFNMMLQLAYGIGNIVGPMTYSASPNPKTPFYAMVGLFGVNIAFILIISGVHTYWNKKRDASMPSVAAVDAEAQRLIDLTDLTDKERPTFRYPY